MMFPRLAYAEWLKTQPPSATNLARSAVDPGPVSLLGLRARDLVAMLPARDGHLALREAIARRYRVAPDQVYPSSGGTTFANWLAVAAALDDADPRAEVLVERPGYESLLRLPEAFGYRVRRFERPAARGYAVDLDRFAALVTRRTRLAIVTNLHNPTGVRMSLDTLGAMAGMLARVGAWLLVDEIYLECLFTRRTASCVHAGPNVITTSSLTKAYGLDGLRAGWILGPAEIVRRAASINNLVTNNSVAPGEQMTLAAFAHLDAIRQRAQGILGPNLRRVRRFMRQEKRLDGIVPPGGNVLLARLPDGVDVEAFVEHLRARYDTAVVPGRFFESPRCIRFSFGMAPALLERGLANISRALDDVCRHPG